MCTGEKQLIKAGKSSFILTVCFRFSQETLSVHLIIVRYSDENRKIFTVRANNTLSRV